MREPQIFFVAGQLPGFNEIARKHWSVYNRLKKQWGITCGQEILVAKIKPVHKCTIHFRWQEKNDKRDSDNISGFMVKVILDALTTMRVIEDDTREFIQHTTHEVVVRPPAPGVLVTITEVDT